MADVYVTYTCKNPKCKKAFVDLDPYNNIDETPLRTRYCPDCVKKGFSNDKTRLSKDEKRKVEIETFIRENNITDKMDKNFIIRYCRKEVENCIRFNKTIIIKNILRRAMEVLSYQDWKQE